MEILTDLDVFETVIGELNKFYFGGMLESDIPDNHVVFDSVYMLFRVGKKHFESMNVEDIKTTFQELNVIYNSIENADTKELFKEFMDMIS